jgi:hypothetical protein
VAAPGPTAAYYEQVLGEIYDAIEASDASAYDRSSGQTWRCLRSPRAEEPRDLSVWVLPDGQASRTGQVLTEGLAVHLWRSLGRDASVVEVARLMAASAAMMNFLARWGGSQGERLVSVQRDTVTTSSPQAGADAWAEVRITCRLSRTAP